MNHARKQSSMIYIVEETQMLDLPDKDFNQVILKTKEKLQN